MTDSSSIPTPENPATEWECGACGLTFTFWNAVGVKVPEECPRCGATERLTQHDPRFTEFL